MKSAAASLRAKMTDTTDYHDKRVEFLCDLNGKLLLLTGAFFVPSQTGSMEIHYTGRIHARDLPLTRYVFPLTATHLHSVVPIKHRFARAEYFMEKPLRIRLGLTRPAAPEEALVGPCAGSARRT